MNSTAAFLRDLYGDDPPGYLSVCTFTNQVPKVHWIKASDYEAAGSLFESLAREHDGYFGVCLHGEPKGNKRGNAAEAIAMAGLWLELDWQDAAHKKTTLPPTQADALSLIDDFPLPPTKVVFSGHGAHVWWLYREPWIFETDGDNAAAAKLSRGFQQHFINKARRKGWEIDNTSDLARVLRPPGTWNRKREPAVAVEVIANGGPRYNPSDFEPFLELPFAPAPQPTQPAQDKPRHDVLRSMSVKLALAGLPPDTAFAALAQYREKHLSQEGRAIPDSEIWGLVNTAPKKFSPEPEPIPVVMELVSIQQIMKIKVPPPEYVIPGWCVDDTLLVVAPGGTAKSILTFSMAVSLASHREVLDKWRAPNPVDVLVIQEEDPPELSVLRAQRLAAGLGLGPDDFPGQLNFTKFRSGFNFAHSDWVEEFERCLDRYCPRLVFIDSISKVSGIEDQNKREQVTRFFRDRIDSIKRDRNLGVVLVHHANKMAHAKVATVELAGMVTGSQAFVDNSDSTLYVSPTRGDTQTRTCSWAKVRRGGKPTPFKFRFVDLVDPLAERDAQPVRLEWDGEVKDDQNGGDKASYESTIQDIFEMNPGVWFVNSRLVSMVGCSKKTISRVAKSLGLDERVGGGRNCETEYRLRTGDDND